ncbi:DUF6188 family protein [Kitasatospora sp. NBC_01287]|uniref:DUF6188 family protein n=1 Tax=Kitasatospora sp. NBC_01287 TaxID=2903573 RepID=UPI00224FE189|nr:DUF6188 family protein [Kitasatospora sp. NBC_01287]MCX4747343.1 DUF6188 family protein [Kitasatospora sp. NBC_01287]
MANEMTELPDRRILPLRGHRVVDITWAGDITFELDPPGEITVGADALFTKGAVTAPGANPTPLSQFSKDEVRQTVGTEILSAVAFNSGALRVVFNHGWHLNVSSKGLFVPAAVKSGESVTWTRHRP